MPFKVAVEDGALAPQEKQKDYIPVILSFARYVVPLIIGIVFIIFVIKPLMKALTTASPAPAPIAVTAGGPQMMQPPAALEKIPEIEKREGSVKGGVIEWAKKNPREASELVRGWITEE